MALCLFYLLSIEFIEHLLNILDIRNRSKLNKNVIPFSDKYH